MDTQERVNTALARVESARSDCGYCNEGKIIAAELRRLRKLESPAVELETARCIREFTTGFESALRKLEEKHD